MLVIFAAPASACSASVSTLPKTMSGCFSDDAPKIGANWRHGPHHAAQKSTRTISLSTIVCSKVAAVVDGCHAGQNTPAPWGIPQGRVGARSARVDDLHSTVTDAVTVFSPAWIGMESIAPPMVFIAYMGLGGTHPRRCPP